MVWGGISHGVKTPLVVIQGNLTAVRYRDQMMIRNVRCCKNPLRSFVGSFCGPIAV